MLPPFLRSAMFLFPQISPHTPVFRTQTVLVLLLLLLAAPCGIAQPLGLSTLRGTVVDSTTGEPLEGAHVFIASSMLGTTTDARGTFVLPDVLPGTHHLYASMLGFASARRVLRLPAEADSLLAFRLQPVVFETGEVVVTAKHAKKWRKRLEKFKRQFIGTSANAEGVTVVNPEVLNFEATWWGRLAADAGEPLVIENEVLGYRLQYFLKEFLSGGGTIRYDGEPLFEELTPESPEQEAAWKAARHQAFYGSFRHFLLALLDGRLREEGFRAVHQHEIQTSGGRPGFRVRSDRVLRDTETPGERALRFTNFIEITYLKEEEEAAYLARLRPEQRRGGAYQQSWIKLTNGPTAIDQNGEPVEPYGVTVYGYFAFEGAAEMLPKEYRPEGWGE